jgi:hypothetical protein
MWQEGIAWGLQKAISRVPGASMALDAGIALSKALNLMRVGRRADAGAVASAAGQDLQVLYHKHRKRLRRVRRRRR